MASYKPIELKSENEVVITNEEKPYLTKSVLLEEPVRGILPVYFLGFHLDYVSEKYALDHKHILNLLYFKELGVFNYRIKKHNTTINIQNYLNMGMVSKIVESRNESFKYMLTPFGVEIVDCFIDSLKNNDRFMVSDNLVRKDHKRELSSVLEDYFNK